MVRSHRRSERVVREMTSAELEQAGILADYWHGGPTYFRDGQELDPGARILLPDTDQPPPPDHSECIGPHLGPDGEHIDCDGRSL